MIARRWAMRFGPLLLLFLLAAAVWLSGAWRELDPSRLSHHHAALRAFTAERPLASLAAGLLVCLCVVLASLPVAGLMALACGYAFGALLGGALALTAKTLGSVLAVAVYRRATGESLVRRLGPRLARLADGLRDNAFTAILALRLIPLAPLSAINLAAGLARAPLLPLAAATALGGAPVSFILAAVGARLSAAVDSRIPVDEQFLTRPEVLTPLIAFSLLSALPVLATLGRKRMGRGGKPRA
jgi:uncharacterized membrane protein YdjX (TVP38/TMEM64 family)